MSIHDPFTDNGIQGAVEDTDNGITGVRTGTIVSTSAVAGLLTLASTYQIGRRLILRMPDGSMPDPSVVYQTVRCEPAGRDAPLGGDAVYNWTAPFSRDDAGDEGGIGNQGLPGGPPLYRVDGRIENKIINVDAYGYPIINAAGEPLDAVGPAATVPTPIGQLNVTWWVESDDSLELQNDLWQYWGAMNSVTWHGQPRGSMLCMGIRLTDEIEQWRKLVGSWERMPPIDVSDLGAVDIYKRASDGAMFGVLGTDVLEGQVYLYPNMGRREFNAAGDDTIKILGEDNQPVSDSVKLTYNGYKADEDDEPILFAIDRFRNPQYKDFLGDLGI